MKTVKKYTNELYKQFHYFATWLPGVPLELGAIGIFKNNEFTAVSSLKNEGIEFDIEDDITKSDLEHATNGAVTITTKLSGTLPAAGSVLADVDAGFTVEFSQQNAILFKANGTVIPRINDQIKLGKEIISRYQQDKWEKDWVVITELVKADSSTIIISSSNKGKVELKANANIKAAKLDIADAGLELGCPYSKDLSTKIITEKGLTPLFKISKIKFRPFMPPVVRARKIAPRALTTSQESNKLPESIIFEEADFELEED